MDTPLILCNLMNPKLIIEKDPLHSNYYNLMNPKLIIEKDPLHSNYYNLSQRYPINRSGRGRESLNTVKILDYSSPLIIVVTYSRDDGTCLEIT